MSSDHIVIFDFRGFTYTRVRLLRLNKKYHKIVERSERDSDSEHMREGGEEWNGKGEIERIHRESGIFGAWIPFFSRRVYEKSGARGGRRPSPFGIATIFQKTEGKKRRESRYRWYFRAYPSRVQVKRVVERGRGRKNKKELSINSITRE